MSERLFAEYLDVHGYEWSFEPAFEGRNKRPDFLVPYGGADLLFEVKERAPSSKCEGVVPYDPYAGIRKPIDKAREKFKEFKDYPCALVIYNDGDVRTLLTPERVYYAMLGDLGLAFPIEDGSGRTGTSGCVLLEKGGSMVHYRPEGNEPDNTTISAAIILERAKLKNVEFENLVSRNCEKEEATFKRSLDAEERARIFEKTFRSVPPESRWVPRVVVCESPVRRVPLPAGILAGPYDERYRLSEGRLTRTFVGVRTMDLEDERHVRLLTPGTAGP